MSRRESAINISAKRNLAEFLVGNTELEELSARLNEFNILQVLRIEKAEIRHSNVLGWLLNPRESHGLSDAFVRRFISTLLMDNEQTDFGLSPARIELMDLVDVEVRREWRNIDVLVHSKSNKLVILIENKIRSRESKGQLRKYLEIAKQNYPDAKVRIPVLLTLEGDEPTEEAQALDYVAWSHVALYKVATEVIIQQQNRIPQDAQTFLRHYLNTLRRETMQDRELEDLCKSIYRKHKSAIDLIVKYGTTTVFGETAEEFIKEHPELEQTKSITRQLWFIPKDWVSKMPNEIKGWSSPYPVSFWFYIKPQEQRIGILLEIGPLLVTERRQNLVEAFRKGGLPPRKKSRKEDSQYTRIYTKIRDVDDPGDSEEIKRILEDLWQQSRGALKMATSVIENFNWSKP